ncbi:hypothetical protein Gogos_006271, partial [Gossypium gossypioides]|nr:hypothetical protein [Gossypium gossypioides]
EIPLGFETPIQAKKNDKIIAHINPAFKSPEKVEIPLTEGVLNPGKHTTVIFKDNQRLSSKNSAGNQNVWLPEDVIQHIVGIPPPHPSKGPDRLSWRHTSTRAFSIKSAYKMMKEDSWDTYMRNGKRHGSCQDHKESTSSYGLFLSRDNSPTYSGSAAVERVLRDEKEDWVLGYNRFLGNCSIFEEKLWGILDGLKLTQRRGMTR